MANTYNLIATQTVGSGGTAQIDFTSIPQTYSDLVLVTSLRTNNTGSNYGEPLLLKFNDITTGFTHSRLEGYSNAVSSSSETDNMFSRANNANQLSNTFSNNKTYISEYTGTSFKTFITDSVVETNTDFNEMYMYGSLWSNTNAITKISLYGNAGGTFVQYSTASLYGINKS